MQHFDRLQTDNEILNRVQDRLKSTINPIADVSILNGRMTDQITVINTAMTNFAHGLGRKYQGWFTVSIDGDGRVFEDLVEGPANNPDKSKFIRLRTGAGMLKVKLWVF